MKAFLVIVGISIVHFVVAFLAFGHSLGGTLAGAFGGGTPPSLFDRLCDSAVDVLLFPSLPLVHAFGAHGAAVQFLIIANSIMWGVGLYGFFIGVAHLLRPRDETGRGL